MYKRILLKISGEALAGDSRHFDPQILSRIAREIKTITELGIEVAVVVGGGNFIRGNMSQQLGIERVQADYMGMLATVINGIALQGALEKIGVNVRLMTALDMDKVAEKHIVKRANRHLSKKRVVIFVAGTGSPFFSTDTTAALRASEIKADVILMAKNDVDGVYDADPKLHAQAQKYDSLSYLQVIEQDLRVMDHSAITMCMDNDLQIVVFNINREGNIVKAVRQEASCTIIRKEVK